MNEKYMIWESARSTKYPNDRVHLDITSSINPRALLFFRRAKQGATHRQARNVKGGEETPTIVDPSQGS
eukprot:3419503-Ditylum_brightwellii.AAC.1